IYLVRKRDDLAFNWVFVMFALFIVACGTTHLMGIWTVWRPNYGAEGLVQLFTAGVSIATAIALIPLMPKVLKLPSARELADLNRELQKSNETLEQRVEEKTREVREHSDEIQRRADEMEQFIYTISHDLKAPLVTNAGFLR